MLQSRTPSKLSSMFSGTQDKCAVCSKTVYPLEKVTLQQSHIHAYRDMHIYIHTCTWMKIYNMINRWPWRGSFTTRIALGVTMEVASWHPHPMLLWMEFFTASTTLHSCSRRRAATTISSRLLQWRKVQLQPCNPNRSPRRLQNLELKLNQNRTQNLNQNKIQRQIHKTSRDKWIRVADFSSGDSYFNLGLCSFGRSIFSFGSYVSPWGSFFFCKHIQRSSLLRVICSIFMRAQRKKRKKISVFVLDGHWNVTHVLKNFEINAFEYLFYILFIGFLFLIGD